jgi:antitoxin MazE
MNDTVKAKLDMRLASGDISVKEYDLMLQKISESQITESANNELVTRYKDELVLYKNHFFHNGQKYCYSQIPKTILEQTGIMDDVEIEVENNQIIIRPVKNVREGWDKAFKLMGEKGDDNPLIDEILWDEEEWQW